MAGLVAYGASDDSDLSDEEEEEVVAKPSATAVVATVDGHISDEEEEFFGEGDGLDGGGFDEPDLMSLIAKKLPQALKAKKVAAAEDVGPIPDKKDYGEKVEEPPPKRQKRTGPVKITIPSLAQFKEEEEEALPSVRVEPSRSGSGLFALLPRPKHRGAAARPVASQASQARPAAPAQPALLPIGSASNLKPSGVRTVGLVPHRVANPVKVKAAAGRQVGSDSEEEDDLLGMGPGSSSSSYFPPPAASTGERGRQVNPTPGGPAAPMRSLAAALPADPSYVSLHIGDDLQPTGTDYQSLELGPAVAPYPPPAPTYSQDTLIDNQEAISRLAGRSAKLREFKDELKDKIIDINEDDMKGDPRVWMTKAMTEEKAHRPTGKGPKGLAKSRHQITYLAHQAKERDWELKQEWATARENRTASRNKYGFI